MDCPECGGGTVAFAVPRDCREFLPGDEPAAALCLCCLSLRPVPEDDVERDPEFTGVSDAFPTDEAAIPMALVVGLLDSLALHRAAVEALLARVERAGVDPLLVLDRLAADPTLDPAVDLVARREQVAQFRR